LRTLCFFHEAQLTFRPKYEWALGKKIDHPERTERADRILAALQDASKHFDVRAPEDSEPLEEVTRQHAPRLLRLYETAAELDGDREYHPSVFMRRNGVDPDPTNIHHAGYFCFDSGTPLTREALRAALCSASCAIAAADALQTGDHGLVYALSRPPGHHASYDSFGGYCYMNNSALAAHALRRRGRVAVLDVDVHHGNGTQSLFWRDADVLTLSIHGDPTDLFPYFSGKASENGEGAGRDRNINIPLPAGTDGAAYLETLDRSALPAIKAFEPTALVVAAGVDGYRDDPIGNFDLTTEDFHRIGERIGRLGLPTCAIQEGGYYTPKIGDNVLALLDGLREGLRRTRT